MNKVQLFFKFFNKKLITVLLFFFVILHPILEKIEPDILFTTLKAHILSYISILLTSIGLNKKSIFQTCISFSKKNLTEVTVLHRCALTMQFKQWYFHITLYYLFFHMFFSKNKINLCGSFYLHKIYAMKAWALSIAELSSPSRIKSINIT